MANYFLYYDLFIFFRNTCNLAHEYYMGATRSGSKSGRSGSRKVAGVIPQPGCVRVSLSKTPNPQLLLDDLNVFAYFNFRKK